MQYRALHLLVFALLIYLFMPSVYAQVDTVVVDSLAVKDKTVLSKLDSETKSLSKYFSLTKIAVSIFILICTYIFLRIISAIIGIWAERTTKNRVTIKGLIPLIRIISWTGSLTFILVAVFRPPMASILAFSASIGVAVGFASQDLLKNVFGGIVIIFDRPFQIGDKVQIGDHYGEIVGIGLRSTRLVTNEDNLVSVPNLEIMNSAVSNANSGEENCQVVTEIFLPLGSDVDRVRAFAIETVQVSKHIFLNKPIVVLFAQENIGYKVLMKVKIKAYVNDLRNEFAFKSEVTEMMTKEFADLSRDLSNADFLD